MRKIFLFLFAAVLSIGTASAQTELFCEDATVTLESGSLVIQAMWGERQVIVSLWQETTQGTGTYAAADVTGMLMNPWKQLTAVNDECSYQEMGGTFAFSGYMSDGTDTYDVWIRGSLESSTPETGEMEAKTNVEFSYEGEGVWAVVANADDSSWGMQLSLAYDEMTGEYNASGYYITNLMTGDMVEVAGTGLLYYDDFTGRMVFKANSLTDGSSEIYPTLYASSMDLGFSNTTFPAEASPWEDYGHTGYSYILLASDDWIWSLDLHIKNFNGAGDYSLDNPTYEEEVWNDYLGDFETVTKTLYSKYNENIPIMGDITVTEDEGLLSYECYLYTVDAEGNMGTMLTAIVMESNAETFDIEADNATVAEGNYPLEFTCEWNGHSVKVEVTDVKYNQEIMANFIFDGGIMNGGDQVEGEVMVTKVGDIVTVRGSFESWGSGNTYNVVISGTLPAGILETVVFEDEQDYSTLLTQYAGEQVNVQVERTLYNDGWNTLTIPFDVAASQIGNIKAYQVTKVVANSASEIELILTNVSTLKAGQPYLIEVLSGRNIWGFEAKGVVIKNEEHTVTVSGANTTVTMHGVLNTTGETTNGLYWIGDGGYLYNDDVDKLGLRAYFSITSPSGIAPRMRVVTSENETTGVDNITTSENATKAIVNGQLVIIRDGEMYNVQGQLVK